MIFVDTSAWYSTAIDSDPHHVEAAEFLRVTSNARLVTSDYVLDETLTLFRIRGAYPAGVALGQSILAGAVCQLERANDADVMEAFRVFQQFSDKNWSFTDCVSFVMMRRLGIAEAFAFDAHFKQFGSIRVVPVTA